MAQALVDKLRGAAPEREAAYQELLRLVVADHAVESESDATPRHDQQASAEIAVACASPLCAVLCKPVAEVSAEEWHRVCEVLYALSGLDPARVGGECQKADQVGLYQADQYPGVWLAPESAHGAVVAKEPASLTAEDALIVAKAISLQAVQHSTSAGMSATCVAAGMTEAECAGMIIPAQLLLNTRSPTDERHMALVPHMLEWLKTPEQLSDSAHSERAVTSSLSFLFPTGPR